MWSLLAKVGLWLLGLIGKGAVQPSPTPEQTAQDQRAAAVAQSASARTTIADMSAAQVAKDLETAHVATAVRAADDAAAGQLRHPDALRDDDGFRRD